MRSISLYIFVILFTLFLYCSGLNNQGYQQTSSPYLQQVVDSLKWTHISSTQGAIPVPGPEEQTACIVVDIDQDGIKDIVIGSRKKAPALVWLKYQSATEWQMNMIESDLLPIEAGGSFYDIDGDGDQDLVFGADATDIQVWWWENPYPNFDSETSWIRREIKDKGGKQHHDQIFGDFNNNGQPDLVFWNQRASRLFLAEIPSDPKNTLPWPYVEIFSGSGEGLAAADIDQDGLTDLIAAGRWYKHENENVFDDIVIDPDQGKARVSAGDLVLGGYPEVVMVAGDGVGPLRWYEATGDPTDRASWVSHDLLPYDVDHGHSLDLADFNADGYLDIFCAEMRLNAGNEDAKMWIFFGDGKGNFKETVIATGYGNHESKPADLDGDGDLDIFGKPYNWETPRVDIWLNEFYNKDQSSLDQWQRHVIDNNRPWRAIFIQAEDIDRDGFKDIISGGWWYKSSGKNQALWPRTTIGEPLNNIAMVFDFDQDDDPDILGTGGKGAEQNDTFIWAENDGEGNYIILDNVSAGDGDFLQGVAIGQFDSPASYQISLSWHASGRGIQFLQVPDNPATTVWPWSQVSKISQDEDLSIGDIDRDGDMDLLLGTRWLRNNSGSWEVFTLSETSESPDRNELRDINRDGKLDAIVGFEAINEPGKLAWYEQGNNPDNLWTEHIIANIIGPMSLDVQDMDGDGDFDVVAGEHNLANPEQARLFIFENLDTRGTEWQEHIVFTGDEHHDGARITDIDQDGDFDIISIGWGHANVLLYENKTTKKQLHPPMLINWLDTVSFFNTENYILRMINLVYDADTPLENLSWQFDVLNDSVLYNFNAATYDLILTAPDYVGMTTLICTVTDEQGLSATDSIIVSVTGETKMAPVLTNLPDSIVFNNTETYTLEVTGLASDPDAPDSLLIWNFEVKPEDIVWEFNPDVAILTFPAQEFTGNGVLYCTVTDEQGLSATDSIIVSVTGETKMAPVLTNLPDSIVFNNSEAYTLEVTGLASDPDAPDSLLTWQFRVKPEHIDWEFVQEIGVLNFPVQEYHGNGILYCTVIDRDSLSDQDSINITIIKGTSTLLSDNSNLPEQYILFQNYPNPFNPETEIKFGLPKAEPVRLTVFNVLGEIVAILVNDFKSAGYHSLKFSANSIPSGLYYYIMEADNFRQVKKMVLLR